MTNQCAHGQLARACELCEADAVVRQLAEDLGTVTKDRSRWAERAQAAERERDAAQERLRTIAVALRDLSPGPHPGPMDAEEYLPLVREELLRLAERGGDAMDECERLKASACRERGLPPQQTCCGCGRWWGGPVCDVCAAKGVTSTKGGG